MKILTIEDNRELASSIYDYLAQEHYVCELVSNVVQAKEKLLLYSYDCVILDIMLPDGSGMDILHFIKEAHLGCSVLIVSAKGALDDKIEGFENGADDYITKPFHLPELHARLKAIHRRNRLDGSNLLVFNELLLNTDSFALLVHNQAIEVTRKEFELLLYFLVNRDRVLSKQAIASHLWGDYTYDLDNVDFVYQHVKNLRKKLSTANAVDYIDTVYGLGYKFNSHKT
ncbi:response regulator transcription factor [Olivibacter sitiensis]|uniref:response regulator transcription factor n=1 Tax=Olivibacter sitiensis TaxID=376470 RepID=UPI0004275498|nr:response regulator transcription factor [Olivibacter sitiensis]